jgi:DinB superfamily
MQTMDGLTQVGRERLTSYLAETHDQVLQTVRAFSAQQLDFRPAPDRWSISENVEHLTIVHNLIMNYVKQVISLSASLKESAWKGRDEVLLEHIRSRSTPLKVPEIGSPKNQWAHEELFRRFEEIRNRICEFAATTNAPLRSFCFPHPVFGEKDCYQWLLGMGAHCERHLAQIHEVTLSADFPKFEPSLQ